MEKESTHFRLDPALKAGLVRLQKKLPFDVNRTQLVETAIRDLLKKHGIRVDEARQ